MQEHTGQLTINCLRFRKISKSTGRRAQKCLSFKLLTLRKSTLTRSQQEGSRARKRKQAKWIGRISIR